MQQNPFIISGYLSPEYFCDREAETERMYNAVGNGRHLTLISPRRMGKTGLIRHFFGLCAKKKEFTHVYVDIMATSNLREFTEVFGKAVLTELGKNEALMKKLLRSLSALRLKLSIDHLSGQPSVSFEVNSAREAEKSLDAIFKYMALQHYRIAIAIDEFQQVTAYPENNVEALLRTHLQAVNNVTLIFSGSLRHILAGIFSSPARPLYNITEMMEIGNIDEAEYKKFIIKHFRQGGFTISDAALTGITEITGLHTFYVQNICNRLFGESKDIDSGDVDNCLIKILRENEAVYGSYLNLLTTTQYRVLRAVALNGGIDNPLSNEFLSRYELGAASSVSQAIRSLTDKEFVFLSNGRLRLTDVFLAQWIIFKTVR